MLVEKQKVGAVCVERHFHPVLRARDRVVAIVNDRAQRRNLIRVGVPYIDRVLCWRHTGARISTPNLVNIVSLLEQPLTPIKEQYIKLSTDKHIPFALGYRPGFVVNNFFHDFGHCFIFDAECLRLALEKVGFTEVQQWTPGKSDDANLTGIESHQKIVGDAVNDFETLTMEALKPV